MNQKELDRCWNLWWEWAESMRYEMMYELFLAEDLIMLELPNLLLALEPKKKSPRRRHHRLGLALGWAKQVEGELMVAGAFNK